MELITSRTEGLAPLAGDLTGQVLVIRHTVLNRRYQMPRFQLFKATGGFGCKESSLGRAVFGMYLADSTDDRRNRGDFIGIATSELIHQAMQDTTPVPSINPHERVYFLFTKDGHCQTGDTVNQAMQRLRLITRSPVTVAYRAHPESSVNDLGYLSYPEGTTAAEVKIKRRGGTWIDAS